MRRSPRLRKALKWTGLVLLALLLGAWIASCFGAFKYSTRGFRAWSLRGAVGFSFLDTNLEFWSFKAAEGAWYWKPRWKSYGFQNIVPLWCPFAIIAMPTALLWHRDRRLSKPGLCRQCGYDIRGLQTCPECGVEG